MSAPDNPAMQPPPDSRPEAPRVSVIVRTIGRASLDTALTSVAAQTYRPIEIVLVEAQGGSGQAWPPDLQGVDLQVPATGGQRLARAAAANFGLRHARGELALFLDDDDLLLPTHIARLQAALAAAPAAPAAFTDTDYGYPDAEGWHSLHRFEGGFDAVRLRFENFLPIHSVLFRLDARTPRVDEAFDLFEDWDFWLQMARLGDFVHVPGISARYVAAEGQRSGVFVDSPATRQARQQLLAKWQTTSTAAGHAALVDRLQQLYRHHAQAEAVLAAATDAQAHLQQVATGREQELAAAAEQLAGLQDILAAREQELTSAAEQAQGLKDLLSAREAERDAALTEIAALRAVVAARDEGLAEAARQAEGLKALVAQREADWASAAAYADDLRQHLALRNDELARAAEERQRFVELDEGRLRELAAARAEIEQARAETAAVRAELQALLAEPPLRALAGAWRRSRQR
jgi:hypothetical protein